MRTGNTRKKPKSKQRRRRGVDDQLQEFVKLLECCLFDGWTAHDISRLAMQNRLKGWETESLICPPTDDGASEGGSEKEPMERKKKICCKFPKCSILHGKDGRKSKYQAAAEQATGFQSNSAAITKEL